MTGTGAVGDVLYGGRGNDTLFGQGNATLYGGEGRVTDRRRGDVTASFEGATNSENVDLTLGIAWLANAGIAGQDVLQNIRNVVGSKWDDRLTGDANANALHGGAGQDRLVGLAGADTLDGGADFDTVSYEASGSAVVVDLAQGIGSGGDAEGDHLVSIEAVVGSAFDDILKGDAGSNVLDSGGGIDTLSGGEGDDQYVVSDPNAVVIEAADTGYDIVRTSTSYSLSDNVEELIYTGQLSFIGTGNAQNNTITGGNADDSLYGGAGNNSLDGSGGNDHLDGGTGDDTLRAGEGSATLIGGSGNNSLYGSGGNYLLGGSYLLDGGSGDDTLSVGEGSGTMYGGSGNDVFLQGSGSNQYHGGEGNNSVVVQDKFNVVVNLQNGIGTDAFGSIDSYDNIQNVAGTFRSDQITGDSQNNILYGGGGTGYDRGWCRR